jgi:hypothetical protein
MQPINDRFDTCQSFRHLHIPLATASEVRMDGASEVEDGWRMRRRRGVESQDRKDDAHVTTATYRICLPKDHVYCKCRHIPGSSQTCRHMSLIGLLIQPAYTDRRRGAAPLYVSIYSLLEFQDKAVSTITCDMSACSAAPKSYT